MAGASFYVIQGTISRATLHSEIQSNKLSCSLFMKYFTNQSGDIGIMFNGCEMTLSVPWHNVIYYSHIIMFFGKCFDQLRPWGPVFCFKTDPEYAHHMFRQFTSEYFSDSQASAQLFASYKDCMYSVYLARCKFAESMFTQTRAKAVPSFNFEGVRMFHLSFNNICRHSFLTCFSDFNDYSMPILQTLDFTNYLNASK